MTDNVIPAQTTAFISNPFRVHSGKPIAVVAWNLAGAETVKIQISRGDGTEVFDDILDASGTLTATAYQSSITAGGLYRLTKTATAAAAGASIGQEHYNVNSTPTAWCFPEGFF